MPLLVWNLCGKVKMVLNDDDNEYMMTMGIILIKLIIILIITITMMNIVHYRF